MKGGRNKRRILCNDENKRNHYTFDLTVEKLTEEDAKLSLEDAVSYAVNGKNLS